MKFLSFIDKNVDPFLKMTLADLARTLADSNNLEVEFTFHSYYKRNENIVTVSHYWTRLLDHNRGDGMKSDIYLRAFGNVHFTDYASVNVYLKATKSLNAPSFRKQLFCLFEDIRIEQAAIKKRPGMIHAFQARREIFQKRFRAQFTIHREKQEWLDALFCAFYLQLIEKPTILPELLSPFKPLMREMTATVRNLPDTESVMKFVRSFCDRLPEQWDDMTDSYLTMSIESQQNKTSESSLTDKNDLISRSKKKVKDKEDKEGHDEKMPTWHQEQEQEGDNLLQFDLDEGTKTDLIGEGERKVESGNQAFASVQGASRDSDGQNYDEQQPSLNKGKKNAVQATQDSFGEANRHAKVIKKPHRKPTTEEIAAYKSIKADILPVQKPLQQSIKKAIEQKQTAPRNNLHFGRLDKKLLRLITDENPRLFYKKEAETNEWDVTFSLLVDCSASMFDKMEQTKAGLVLFHETLYSLRIPHVITGFWEDALSADELKQPNFFHQTIGYSQSLIPEQGPNILQLEPEEDNRDGFAIRVALHDLLKRQEKRKVLLVFSDGEPSALSYNENGIVDTHEAVLESRRKGVEVIGVFLSNGKPQEKEKETMATIYGHQSLVIPTIEDIPAYLTPLLKRLLLSNV